MHIVGILPDGRSSGETDTGGVAKEKKEYTEGDIKHLDNAARKSGQAIAYALRDDGGDVRIRSLFKDPISTLAAIDRTREAYATILDIIHTVQAPIERGRVEVAVAEAVGRGKPKTLIAKKEEMKEELAVKKVGLTEERKGLENILVNMGLEEAVLAQVEKQLMIAVGTSTVATIGDMNDWMQSKVIEAAKSLVPKVIESARTTVNGVRYLRDRIEETATILKNAGAQMVIAAQEMGQDMFELTGESLRAYLERDKNGYFNLINELKMDALQKAEARNGVNVNDDAALAKYHLSLSTNADSVEHRIFEHSPGDGRHPGKLVLIFLGNFQPLGDEEAGLYKFAREQAKREGYEVLTFRVGDLYQQNINEVAALDSFELHPDVVLSQTKTIIEDRVQRRGLFAGAQQITIVGSEHYSRGGGTGDKLFGNEDSVRELLGGATLKATAYIDAVSLDSGASIARRPAAEHFFNAYQEHTHSYIDIMPGITPGLPPALPYFDFGHGQPVRGQNIVGAENELQNYGTTFTHLTIDDNLAQLMIDKVLSSL